MKRIFYLVVMMFAFVAIQAQTLTTWTKSTDTLANSTTVNLTMSVRGSYDHAVFQTVATKVSGTPGGSAKLYGSVDGTNYHAIRAAADTLALANVTTNSKIWEMDSIKYPYYKIVYTGHATTFKAIPVAKAHFKKK